MPGCIRAWLRCSMQIRKPGLSPQPRRLPKPFPDFFVNHRPSSDDTNGMTAPLRGASRALMLLLIAMTAVGPLSLNIAIPSLPSLASGLMTSTASAQLTVSLYLLALASGQLMMGSLADKFG